MVRFTRACVRRLSDHAMAGVDKCLAGESTWTGGYDVEQALDDKERKFFSEMDGLCPARYSVLHELAQLNVSRHEFFNDDGRMALYWFLRDHVNNVGIIEVNAAWGSSLRNSTAWHIYSPFGIDAGSTFVAHPELASATAGSDEHIEFMLKADYSKAEERLIAIFGKEQFERDFDVMARFNERWPSIKARLHELDLEAEA